MNAYASPQGAIDGHQHFWDAAARRPRWVSRDLEELDATFLADDLAPLLFRNRIAGSIAVQADRTDEESEFLLSVAEETSWVEAVVVWLDLRSSRQSRAQLARLAGHPKLRGVREPLSDRECPGWLLQPETLRSIELVEERGLVLEIAAIFPAQFSEIGYLAARFPRLTIIVDHLGKPPVGTDAMGAWAHGLSAVAEHPNVHAKISGLTTTVRGRKWTATTFASAVEAAARVFAPDRLIAGSDWPVCLLNGTYDQVWKTTERLARRVFPGCEELVLGATARRVYRLAH